MFIVTKSTHYNILAQCLLLCDTRTPIICELWGNFIECVCVSCRPTDVVPAAATKQAPTLTTSSAARVHQHALLTSVEQRCGATHAVFHRCGRVLLRPHLHRDVVKPPSVKARKRVPASRCACMCAHCSINPSKICLAFKSSSRIYCLARAIVQLEHTGLMLHVPCRKEKGLPLQ